MGRQLLQIKWLFIGKYDRIGQLIVKTIVCTDVQPVFIYFFQKSSDWWIELCLEGDGFFICIPDGITCQGFGSYDMWRAVDVLRNKFVRMAPG